MEAALSLGLAALLLASGFWVAGALLATGLLAIYLSTSVPVGTVMSTTLWSSINSYEVAALPLFVWMGEILFRSSLAEDMFAGLSPFLRRLPGRLLHTNVLGCVIFAAVSGSSAATTATIGRMSLPELKRRGYDERMAIGTLAGSGTLGLLIPPSIILIVYGAATEQSIARLFMAGVLPGLMLAVLFMAYVGVWSLASGRDAPADPSSSFRDKLGAARRLMPVVLLIGGVIGSIYAGVASPTEAAAVGVAGALVLTWASGSLSWAALTEGLSAATRTSAMIALILAGAAFLTQAMAFTGLPRDLADWIATLGLSRVELLLALLLFYVVLGCFLDGISSVVLTMAIVEPMIRGAGIDVSWFGIFVTVAIEMAQITPPIGFNLFVLQGITRHGMGTIAKAALPMFAIMVAMALLLIAVPGIATWLPHALRG